MEVRSRDTHPLTVTVMRLGRPTLYSSPVVHTADDDVTDDVTDGDCWSRDVTRLPDLPHVQVGELLLLPQKSAGIHLGETLACYVCVHNSSDGGGGGVSGEDGGRVVLPAVVSLHLQTVNQRLSLRAAFTPPARLPPGASFGGVIQHEVKELGTHVLVCSVDYELEAGGGRVGGGRSSLCKRFGFEAHKPLDVKTKFYSASAWRVYLEAEIENTTGGAMFLERVAMEPTAAFTARRLAAGDDAGVSLGVRDRRLFLFCVQARDHMTASDDDGRAGTATTDVGRLDISWRSALCQRGRIQTSALHRAVAAATVAVSTAPQEVQVSVVRSPGVVRRLQRFSIGCRAHNTTDRSMQLCLRVATAPASTTTAGLSDGVAPSGGGVVAGLVWRGLSEVLVADVSGGGWADFSVDLEARRVGLHAVAGVTLVDRGCNKAYNFDSLAQVMVVA